MRLVIRANSFANHRQLGLPPKFIKIHRTGPQPQAHSTPLSPCQRVDIRSDCGHAITKHFSLSLATLNSATMAAILRGTSQLSIFADFKTIAYLLESLTCES
jgi:hypothetical protein